MFVATMIPMINSFQRHLHWQIIPLTDEWPFREMQRLGCHLIQIITGLMVVVAASFLVQVHDLPVVANIYANCNELRITELLILIIIGQSSFQ